MDIRRMEEATVAMVDPMGVQGWTLLVMVGVVVEDKGRIR